MFLTYQQIHSIPTLWSFFLYGKHTCTQYFYSVFLLFTHILQFFFSIFPLPFICVCLQYWRVTTSTYLDDNDEINLLGRVPRQEDPQNLSISAKNVTEMTDLFSSFIFLIVGLSFLQVKTIFSEFVIFQAYFEINQTQTTNYRVFVKVKD